MHDPLLDDLDARQREAVTSSARPLAVLAPAGSGKTRVLTRRIAYRVREGDALARHVLAVTFTRKAAGELADRIGRLGVHDQVTAGTFHALALAQLRRRATEHGREPPTVLGSKARLIAPLLRQGTKSARTDVADVATEIEWAKARLITPAEYATAAVAAGRKLPRPPADLADIFERYELEKRRKRLCDFDDLLAWCADAIHRDEEFAAAQHWRFRHLFVDEFQDATPLQLRLVDAWLGGRDDLFVVGDLAQSIYAFAGADAAALGTFADRFPGATTIALERNYRSTPQVVAVAESLLGPESGVARTAPTHAVRPAGDRPRLRGYEDDDAEAAGVVQQMWRAFTDGVPWHRMAVLFRTNAQSVPFEAACARRGIPFRVGGEQRFADRAPVRALIDSLRRSEQAAPGRPFTDHLADLSVDDVSTSVSTHPSGATMPTDDEDTAVHRDALLRLGREYLTADGGRGSLAGFLAWLDVVMRNGDDDRAGADLLTFHRAKGLEWQVVFVTGLERGLVPIAWATDADGIAEERRLLHVALSRATDTLHYSYARARTVRDRRVRREPSPWLAQLEAASGRITDLQLDPRVEIVGVRDTLRAARPPAPRAGRGRR